MHTYRLILAVAAVLLTATDLHGQDAGLQPITLGGAARLAAERSAATAGARARTAQADARVSQQRSAFLPSLSTTANAGARTYNTSSLGLDFPATPNGESPFDPRGEVRGPVRNLDFRTQITQRLVDIPAVLRWRASASEADAARFDALASAEAAATRGAMAYLRVLDAEARISARAADSALALELLDIARQQVAAGVGIALDVTRAESQLADARARLIGTRSERDRAMLQLRRELEMAHNAPLQLLDSLQPPADSDAPITDDEAIRDALNRRTDYRAAQAESQSAQLQARAARSERLPAISLFADHGTTGENTDRLLGTYSYGIQLTIPVFDGLRLQSRAAEQRARQVEAQIRVHDAQRQIETEVRDARIALGAAREEIAAANARLRLAEQEVAQARERFRNGVSGNADVITASIALNGARDLVINTLTAYHVARVSLARAQGTTTSLP
ncbi:MAG TPA: TolC family protein [Gemmatimonadaceae bacterium]|nr:TolC family protein [Gemmatimonadaceae bacterium]